MSGTSFDAVLHGLRPGGTASNQTKNTGTALECAHGLDLDLVKHGDGALDHGAIIGELLCHNASPLH